MVLNLLWYMALFYRLSTPVALCLEYSPKNLIKTKEKYFHPHVNPKLLEMYLSRPLWFRLNRLRTGVGLFRFSVHRWVMAHTAAYECGSKEQNADHIMTSCSNFSHRSRGLGMESIIEKTMAWLNNICPNIGKVFS